MKRLTLLLVAPLLVCTCLCLGFAGPGILSGATNDIGAMLDRPAVQETLQTWSARAELHNPRIGGGIINGFEMWSTGLDVEGQMAGDKYGGKTPASASDNAILMFTLEQWARRDAELLELLRTVIARDGRAAVVGVAGPVTAPAAGVVSPPPPAERGEPTTQPADDPDDANGGETTTPPAVEPQSSAAPGGGQTVVGTLLLAAVTLVDVALVPLADAVEVDTPFAVDIVLTPQMPESVEFAGFQTELLSALPLVAYEPADYAWMGAALVDQTKLALFGWPHDLPVAPLVAERLWFIAAAPGVYAIELSPTLTQVGIPNPGHPGIDGTGTLTGCTITATAPEPSGVLLLMLVALAARRTVTARPAIMTRATLNRELSP